MLQLPNNYFVSLTVTSACLLICAVPDSPPQNVSTIESLVQWNPVPPNRRNGIITGYRIDIYNGSDHLIESQHVNNGSVYSLSLDKRHLLPWHGYNVSVSASTHVGFGPSSSLVPMIYFELRGRLSGTF